MDNVSPGERPLGHYRVVELPGLAPLIAGKTFADLGADVIKLEPPEGDAARALPPFVAGGDDAGASLLWAAYSLGKRGVTAALDTAEGRDIARRLIATADVVIEAGEPGTLERLGLGFETLRAASPGLVLTSLTPFGQTGPHAGWRGSDLVQAAKGGYMNMTGPGDGPPLKPSAPYQTQFHGGMHAVAATLLALRQRRRTGRGAHVDVAIRDTGVWMLTHTYQFWDMLRINLRRQGSARDMGGGAVRLRSVYQTLDGYLVWMFIPGHIGGQSIADIVTWMASHDAAPGWLREIDWMNLDVLRGDPALLPRLQDAFAAFFATRTKAELLQFALAHRVMMAPVQTLRDLIDDPQLAARGAWRETSIAGAMMRVPGPPAHLSDATWEPRGPAHGLGEHNSEIYGELGIDAATLDALRRAGTI